MTVTIIEGDCRVRMAEMQAGSVHCVVTSPPYFNLRDYQADGQIGQERTPAEYVATMVEVCREAGRVLRDDGTLWLVLGDSFAGGGSGARDAERWPKQSRNDHAPVHAKKQTGLPHKSLLGIPWRVAIALQDDGWILRQDVIWSKPNCMPESVDDRCTRSHEYVFMLSKSARYYYDADAIKEPVSDASLARVNQKGFDTQEGGEKDYAGGVNPNRSARKIVEGFARSVKRKQDQVRPTYDGFNDRYAHDVPRPDRNKRSVWTVATVASSEDHFAMFPPKLVTPMILAGCPEFCCSKCAAPFHRVTSRGVEAREVADSELDRFGTGKAGVHRKIGSAYQKWLDENPKRQTGWKPACKCGATPSGGIVLDPFSGAGTTAMVAQGLMRNAIGIELNPEYAARSRARVFERNGMFNEVDW